MENINFAKLMIKLPKSEKDLLTDFIVNLKNKFGSDIEQVILFGSKARGDWDSESDIDLLVLTRHQNKRLENKVVDLAYDIEFERNFPAFLSVIVWSKNQFDAFSNPDTSFVHNLKQEGLNLWQ